MKNQTASTSGDEAMAKLQNKLYNTLTGVGGLNPNTFQILQTGQPLPNTSLGIWSIFNSIPPDSLTQIFSMSEFNNLYDTYRGVILTILPQGGDQFRQVLGDHFFDWEAYKKTLTPSTVKEYGGILQVFTDWADFALDPGTAAKAITIFTQLQNGIVPTAVQKVQDSDNISPNLGPIFTKTIEDLRGLIPQAASKSIKFDSSTESSDISHTWAKGEVSGLYKFFSGGTDGSWDKLSEKAASSKVIFDLKFDHFMSFSAGPGGWYDTAALNLAFKTSDGTVWPAGQHPNWDETFGDNGNFKRLATELVVFDGMTMKMTSSVAYSKSEQEQINANVNVGFWPFFSASASGGSNTTHEFTDEGYLEVTTTSVKGNPAILGVNVIPISASLNYIGEIDPVFAVSPL